MGIFLDEGDIMNHKWGNNRENKKDLYRNREIYMGKGNAYKSSKHEV